MMHALSRPAERSCANEQPRPVSQKEPLAAVEPLGRVVSVSGSQVTVEFSHHLLWPDTNLTVGAFLGINAGAALVIGALSEVSRQQDSAAVGRMDLLGEIVCDETGSAR